MLIEAKGRLSTTAIFDGQTVTLRRGALSAPVVGSGERSIPVNQITAVEFKPARTLLDGYIRFVLAGVQRPRSRAGRQLEDARFDEFAVPFWKKAQPQFEALRDAVQAAIAEGNGAVSAPGSDPAAALRQLNDLRTQGLITPAEYETKRGDILRRF